MIEHADHRSRYGHDHFVARFPDVLLTAAHIILVIGRHAQHLLLQFIVCLFERVDVMLDAGPGLFAHILCRLIGMVRSRRVGFFVIVNRNRTVARCHCISRAAGHHLVFGLQLRQLVQVLIGLFIYAFGHVGVAAEVHVAFSSCGVKSAILSLILSQSPRDSGMMS